jgi:hypothetical protein
MIGELEFGMAATERNESLCICCMSGPVKSPGQRDANHMQARILQLLNQVGSLSL